MPTNYRSRIIVCVGSVLVALFVIFGFPPKRLFDSNLSLIQRTNINPGIDIVGGERLIYEIQIPPGTQNTADMATQVMVALKIRVDPTGLRNLVWRPEGANRLEIELALSSQAGQARKIRQEFSDAQVELENTNVRAQDVVDAVENLGGAQRQARLAALASDSKPRADLFAQMCSTYDQIQKLKAKNLAPEELAPELTPLADTYKDLQSKIAQTNLPAATLQSVLEQASSSDEDQQKIGQSSLDEFKAKFVDFPSRLKAMQRFETAFKDYDAIKYAITGVAELKQLLQGSGVLEFHILADSVTSSAADLQSMEARLGPNGQGPLPQPGDTIRWMQVDRVDEFDRAGQRPETREWNGKHYVPVLVTPLASMSKASGNWGLDRAYLSSDTLGRPVVAFEFNTAGAALFGKLTSYWHNYAQHRGGEDSKSRLAIVLDDKVISAPAIDDAITGGAGIIQGGGQGGFTHAELDYLINTFNAGSLPAQLSSEPISEEDVGPTIGEDNLNRGLMACAFGLIVVGVFLIGYYYVAGIVAFLAVLMNLVLILGVMAALGATFTLPCIAGVILTVGTAVDANVLIFERLREEQKRGLPLRMAMRDAYLQAKSAIIDSNMTSIITSVCLYAFGTEEVKGFGLTLIIGISASLFTALYVTKTVFGIMIDKYGVKNLSSLPLTFPKWDKLLRPSWDWMGKAWIFYTFSIVAITIGMILFVKKVEQGQMMDIEFASGTSVEFQLNEPMDQDKVRDIIDAVSKKDPSALPSPSVVAVGSERMNYEVVSPGGDRDKVKAAVLAAMKPYLHLQLPSTYDNVDADFSGASRDQTIVPIVAGGLTLDGYSPPTAMDHLGGVAIALRKISPPISINQLRQRIANELSSTTQTSAASISYEVQGPGDPNKPTSFAVIIGWNPAVAYAVDPSKWADELAKPLWGLTHDAINRPPSFEKETNFDPQVAGQMQWAAFSALFVSIVGIMIYIWVRFGNLKFGTATVVALLHDTVFTLAAMGFAHYIADYWPHNFLQVEPFRINLTVVAGILTIMGYSMIDTIVVFDRIRENRGKHGHLDRNVINDAINQTLSRTLLTAGTTIMTVSFMYFVGGSGIHGFTFVLLVGILVGTYSSVAIAAPLLLWGQKPAGAAASPGTGARPLGQLQKAAG